MAPEVAARVTSFARACRAAARTVALYPGEHPAVATALGALTQTAQTATAASVLRLAVMPDTLTVDGRSIIRPDAAVSDLALLLHVHQVGQLSIHPLTNADLWRRFLALLALPPDQARIRGGLGKMWATEGEARIEVRVLDYSEMLRAHIRGDQATWNSIVAGCLEGTSLSLDDALVELLFGVLNDPSKLVGVVRAVEARMPSAEAQVQGPMVVAGLLQAVAQFAATSAPGQVESIMAALAEATARLPIETLAPIVETRKGASRSGLARFVQGLLTRISDSSIANLVAGEVCGGRGSSPRLADAFCGLAPDADRRSGILALARNTVAQANTNADPAMAQAWQQSEELLLTYSDKDFVSDDYNAELVRLSNRAIDLDKDHTDPPEQISAWCDTVDDSNLRLLDAALLADLMRLQQDVTQWRDLAGLALNRVNVLLVVGDFLAAALLVEALRSQSDRHDNLAVRDAARGMLQSTLTPSTMRHVASHLDTADLSVVDAAMRFCVALGASAIESLAEVLSREERSRPRKHLIDILVGFGASGRQAVERLRQSPSAAVRRTAVLLLREFGGKEALPELESLLDDAEPHVQREATRAIAMLGGGAAYAMLIRALVRGTERARSSILGVLWTLSDEDAEQVLSHVVLEAPYRGALWPIHMRAVERLGAIGGRPAVDALSVVVERRQIWSPFKMAALHRLAVDALGRIGTSEAVDALEAVASEGPSWARAAARARLDAVTSAADRQGQQA
jgi:hypothetical protein